MTRFRALGESFLGRRGKGKDKERKGEIVESWRGRILNKKNFQKECRGRAAGFKPGLQVFLVTVGFGNLGTGGCRMPLPQTEGNSPMRDRGRV